MESLIRIPLMAWVFVHVLCVVLYRVKYSSGAHPTSYPTGTRGFFLVSKPAGAWSWPLTPI